MKSLHRLLYRSRITPAAAADLDFVVGQIIQRSIHNNRNDSLTGLLATIQGNFIQVLEGPEATVRRAFDRISQDHRHTDIVIISASPAEARLFGEWNMCARALAPSDKAILDVIDSKGPFDPAALTPHSGLRLLTAVADIQRNTALKALIV